jgi:hypothetical protein
MTTTVLGSKPLIGVVATLTAGSGAGTAIKIIPGTSPSPPHLPSLLLNNFAGLGSLSDVIIMSHSLIKPLILSSAGIGAIVGGAIDCTVCMALALIYGVTAYRILRCRYPSLNTALSCVSFLVMMKLAPALHCQAEGLQPLLWMYC